MRWKESPKAEEIIRWTRVYSRQKSRHCMSCSIVRHAQWSTLVHDKLLRYALRVWVFQAIILLVQHQAPAAFPKDYFLPGRRALPFSAVSWSLRPYPQTFFSHSRKSLCRGSVGHNHLGSFKRRSGGVLDRTPWDQVQHQAPAAFPKDYFLPGRRALPFSAVSWSLWPYPQTFLSHSPNSSGRRPHHRPPPQPACLPQLLSLKIIFCQGGVRSRSPRFRGL
jgi:hypothetical protein